MDAQANNVELMRRIAAGDQHAFQTLYQQYGTAVYSLALRILQSTTLAEEVTQDTLLKVWGQKTEWNPAKGELKNWLLTIAHFTAIDRLRQENRQPLLHPDPIDEVAETHLRGLNGAPDWQDNAALRLLVKQLPHEQAELINLAFFGGLSHSEIASATGLPLGTVKTRLRSALRQLRDVWLEAQPTSPSPSEYDV